MNILAVDTSSIVSSVCIRNDSKIISEYNINHRLTHSETLMPTIDMVLRSAELKPKDIDLFVVANGPGSFTGLRIGVGTVKGLAQGNNKPVIGISTLKGLAYNVVLRDGLICPIMDARRNQVYNALYKSKDGKLIEIEKARPIDINELLKQINYLGQKVIFVGDAIEVYKGEIMEKLKGKCTFAPISQRFQKASSLAELVYFEDEKSNISNFSELKPFYLRKSQAERELEKKESMV